MMLKRRNKRSLYLKVFNKYFVTKRVKIILFLFTMITAASYFFTDINLAVSMFFAFVVVGLIAVPILSDFRFNDEDVLEDAFLQYQGIRPGPLNPNDD